MGLRAVVWTCQLPSMSPDPLPRAAAVNKQQTQSTCVEMNKLHIEVFGVFFSTGVLIEGLYACVLH